MAGMARRPVGPAGAPAGPDVALTHWLRCKTIRKSKKKEKKEKKETGTGEGGSEEHGGRVCLFSTFFVSSSSAPCSSFSSRSSSPFFLLLLLLLLLVLRCQAYHSAYNKKEGVKVIGGVALLPINPKYSKGPAPRPCLSIDKEERTGRRRRRREYRGGVYGPAMEEPLFARRR